MQLYNEWQSKTLSIMPRITGSFSLWASGYIVQHVLRSPAKCRKPYHRILVGMSFNVIIGSLFAHVLSTSPMPAGTTFGAAGTEGLCTMAGFLSQGGNLAAPLYSATLATFYLLMIVYGWSNHRISQDAEMWFHLVPNVTGWGTAIAGLCMRLYAPADWTCWIAPYPTGCITAWQAVATGIEATCDRGDDAFIFRLVFKYVLVWFAIAYVSVLMWIIYKKVLNTEGINKKYDFLRLSTHSQSSQMSHARKLERKKQQEQKRSKQISNQAIMYVGALVLTFSFSTAVTILQQSQQNVSFSVMLCMTIFNPLQGLFNLCIYLRPRYISFRRSAENRDLSFIKAFSLFVRNTFFSFEAYKKANRGRQIPLDQRRPRDSLFSQFTDEIMAQRELEAQSRKSSLSSACLNAISPRSNLFKMFHILNSPPADDDVTSIFAPNEDRKASQKTLPQSLEAAQVFNLQSNAKNHNN